MDMNDGQRNVFAVLLKREQRRRFGDVAKAAYTAAGVNSTTWARAVGGLTLKRASVNQIVRNLWPETEGDWTKVVPTEDVGPQEQDAYVTSIGELTEPGVTNDELLREIRAVRREQQELSKRMAKLEQQGPESLGGASGPV